MESDPGVVTILADSEAVGIVWINCLNEGDVAEWALPRHDDAAGLWSIRKDKPGSGRIACPFAGIAPLWQRDAVDLEPAVPSPECAVGAGKACAVDIPGVVRICVLGVARGVCGEPYQGREHHGQCSNSDHDGRNLERVALLEGDREPPSSPNRAVGAFGDAGRHTIPVALRGLSRNDGKRNRPGSGLPDGLTCA